MYHRVADERFDPWGLAVDPSRFEQQMQWLVANRTTIPLVEFSRRQEEGTLPADAISLTFDDGYACTARVAAPVLSSLGLPAIVFLPTELIKRQREFWWDELERIVLEAPRDQLKIDKTLIEIGPKHDSDRQWLAHARPRTRRQKAFRLLWGILREASDKRREALLADLRHQAEVVEQPRDSHRPMTVAEVRGLRSAQIEVGSHGKTHVDLPCLRDDDKQTEIVGSIEICEEIAGETPRAFAYPYGRTDKATTDLVARSGYETACTTEPPLGSSRTHRFALPRLAVGDWEVERFKRRLRGHT
jgi:peptidoglycan/xylan/chitin deacetylase (PgdA/CDA1 family)